MNHEAENSKYQHQRQAAVRSAAAVFAEKEFSGSGTRDIAGRIGIEQDSLYYYFKCKEEAHGFPARRKTKRTNDRNEPTGF